MRMGSRNEGGVFIFCLSFYIAVTLRTTLMFHIPFTHTPNKPLNPATMWRESNGAQTLTNEPNSIINE